MNRSSPRSRLAKLKLMVQSPKNQTLNLSTITLTSRRAKQQKSIELSNSAVKRRITKSLMQPSKKKNTSLFGQKGELVLPLLIDSTINYSSISAQSTHKINRSRKRISILSSDCIDCEIPVTEKHTPNLKTRSSFTDPVQIFENLDLPITPSYALELFSPHMSLCEQGEILEYKEIWFLGLGAKKPKPNLNAPNQGMDDDKGDYTLVSGDHIAYRYEIKDVLGKGSFGQVVKCFDHKQQEFVAVKIIKNKRRFHKQAAIEVKVLELIKANDPNDISNAIHIKDHFSFRKHLCISFELLSINLYELMKSNSYQGFSLSLIRRFALQLLCCLKFIYEHNIVHCDLKPENILLKQSDKSGIKIIDFGSACFENEKMYTYIQSRFYRAPEIILGIEYTKAIDMWSFGCVLAELFLGYPLFPGENEAEQLLCMMEMKGTPPGSLLEISSRKNMFFDNDDRPKIVPNSKGRMRYPSTKNLADKIRCNDPLFVDLIEKCLDWDPKERIKPADALQHPWILESINGFIKHKRRSRSKGEWISQ
ncbi:DYRK4_8 [Blepharisma stoltei]|uniref:dual-specificity kinase n=1 Tax=Blepharisma stoltei TaxID=1481888 RepID=A0AAU9JFJ7_9CILI|nr:unnamed protein product [Blepharisma stoltei]